MLIVFFVIFNCSCKPNPREPERRGPEGWGPGGWEAQNFALFFSLSRRKIRSFLPSLGVFSWNFGGV